MKIAVLVSGRGSNLEALLKARAGGGLPHAELAVVLSNNPEARGLELAATHGVETVVIDHRGFPGGRKAHDAAVARALLDRGVEAVVLAGYMRLIGSAMLEAFPRRIINIHPSLLPCFPGLHAQQQALDWGVKVSGCTVHFVDEGMDSGPIILQRSVPVLDGDDEEALAARILVQEHQAIVETVDLLTRGALTVEGRRVCRKENRVEILIATGNQHKVQEIAAILEDLPVTWRSTAEWPGVEAPEENGATYAENAAIKALEWARRTGLPTVADDSGLEVDALGGRPGLYSARYATAGEDPRDKMLGEMEGKELRTARFVCHAVLAGPDGILARTEGRLEGKIGTEKRGAGGFGFDPVFLPEGRGDVHLAELSEDEKNRISHRGRAFQALAPAIRRLIDNQ